MIYLLPPAHPIFSYCVDPPPSYPVGTHSPFCITCILSQLNLFFFHIILVSVVTPWCIPTSEYLELGTEGGTVHTVFVFLDLGYFVQYNLF